MLEPLKKLRLCTKVGPETVHKYSHESLFETICWLTALTKVFLQLELYIELLIH